MRTGTLVDTCDAGRCPALVIVLLAFLPVSACTSVQYLGTTGEPRLIGLGGVDRVPAAIGRVYRVRAPGIGLRLGFPSTGMTLGLGDALYFVPACDACEPIAYEVTVYGAEVRSDGIRLGYGREFGVPLPNEESVVHFVEYDEERPEQTQVWKKEETR